LPTIDSFSEVALIFEFLSNFGVEEVVHIWSIKI